MRSKCNLWETGGHVLSAVLGRNTAQEKYHYLQFPRAADASLEAELVASRIVRSDQKQWRRIADYFVWGNYRELNSYDVPFDEVQIEVQVEYWDGKETRGEFTLVGTAGKVDELVDNIVGQVESIASEKPEQQVNDTIRSEIAEAIFQRSEGRKDRTQQVEMKDASHPTQQREVETTAVSKINSIELAGGATAAKSQSSLLQIHPVRAFSVPFLRVRVPTRLSSCQ